MSSVRFGGVFPPNSFDAGVVEVRPDAPQTAPQTMKPQITLDGIADFLWAFTTDNPDLRARRKEFLDVCDWLLEKGGQFIAEMKALARSDKEERLEAANARCRELLARKADIEMQMKDLLKEWEERKHEAIAATDALNDVIFAKARMRYPSSTDITKADAAILQAEQKKEQADLVVSEPYNEYKVLKDRTLSDVAKELCEAEATVIDLRRDLGEHGTTSLGIQV